MSSPSIPEYLNTFIKREIPQCWKGITITLQEALAYFETTPQQRFKMKIDSAGIEADCSIVLSTGGLSISKGKVVIGGLTKTQKKTKMKIRPKIVFENVQKAFQWTKSVVRMMIMMDMNENESNQQNDHTKQRGDVRDGRDIDDDMREKETVERILVQYLNLLDDVIGRIQQIRKELRLDTSILQFYASDQIVPQHKIQSLNQNFLPAIPDYVADKCIQFYICKDKLCFNVFAIKRGETVQKSLLVHLPTSDGETGLGFLAEHGHAEVNVEDFTRVCQKIDHASRKAMQLRDKLAIHFIQLSRV